MRREIEVALAERLPAARRSLGEIGLLGVLISVSLLALGGLSWGLGALLSRVLPMWACTGRDSSGPAGGGAGRPAQWAAAKGRRWEGMDVRIKRVHEAPAPEDGVRVLVDGLWPRGVSRARAALDEWARDLAPSADLRRWFGHDPARFREFRARYRGELAGRPGSLGRLRRRAAEGPVTLVYAARDPQHNNAQVLAELLREMTPPTG